MPESRFSDLLEQELDRKAAGKTLTGIDLSRYQAPEEPGEGGDLDEWRSVLKQAYVSSSHLAGRQCNLQLLSEYGKNAWLVGNSQLEEILAHLEKELADLKARADEVNRARKAAQVASQPELTGLDQTWRHNFAEMIQVQVAAAELRHELEVQRQHRGP